MTDENELSLLTLSMEFEKVMREAREAIQAAVTLIDNQEDGPVTMRAALAAIGQCFDLLDTEVWLLKGDLMTSAEINAKLRAQLGEVARQRDILLRWYTAATYRR
jgi:hypothetical protein